VTVGLLFAAAIACAAPLACGAIATMVAAAVRRTPLDGLTVHSLVCRSPIDCAWVPPSVLRRVLTAAEVRWTTVAGYAPAAEHGRPSAALCFDDAHRSVYDQAMPVLPDTGARATVFVVSSSLDGRSVPGDVYGRQPSMSVGQLREWAGAGHEVGSHTATHAALTYLSPLQQRRELEYSRKALEDATGASVSSISFPYGCWNRRVWDVAREVGYTRGTVSRGAVAGVPGLLRVSPAQRFDSSGDLLQKLSSESPLIRARRVVMEQFSRGTPVWRFRSTYRVGWRQDSGPV